jgi:hypothetical protein
MRDILLYCPGMQTNSNRRYLNERFLNRKVNNQSFQRRMI